MSKEMDSYKQRRGLLVYLFDGTRRRWGLLWDCEVFLYVRSSSRSGGGMYELR